MKTLYTLAISFALTISFAHAQAWRNGVVYFLKGDSLTGQVQDLDESVTRSHIVFRSSPESQQQTFTMNEATAYKILKPAMSFEVIEADINHYNKFPVPEGDNPVVEREHVHLFGEVMFRSADVTLYSIIDKYEKERLFVRHDGELEELIHVKYRVEKPGGALADVERTEYIAQVKSIIHDCPTKKKSFPFSAPTLVNIFQDYAVCKHGTVEFAQANAGNDVRVGLTGWTGAGSRHAEKLAIDVYAVSLQVLPRKNNNRFIWVELGMMKGEHRDAAAGSKTYTNKNITFGLYVGTYFGHGKLQPLFYIGASSGLVNAGGGIGLAWKKAVVLSGGVAFVKDYPQVGAVRLSIFPRFK